MLVPSMIGMTVGRVMQGAAAAGLWTAALSLVSDNVHPARAGRVTALTMFGHSVRASATPLRWILLTRTPM